MTAADHLTLGWDRREITPTRPIPLAGYASRADEGPAEDVLSPLHVRTIALRHGDRRAVIVVADLLCWGPDNVEHLRRECEAVHGLRPDELFLCATHTHSAPQPSSWFTDGLGVADAEWVARCHREVVAGIGAALATAVPVTLDTTHGRHELGIDRRFARSAGRESAEALSQRLTVINFRTGGSVVATLFHHACHPTLHHGNAVSAEFPGAAMSSLEESGNAAIAVYLQGCCGNVNPDAYDGTTFLGGDQAAVVDLGEQLADAVRRLLAGDTTPIEPDLAGRLVEVDLPTEPAPAAAELSDLVNSEHVQVSQWSRLLLAHPERRTGAPLTISSLRFGAGLGLVGMSAEVTSPYADHVTAVSEGTVISLGYCNGMLGYVVTAKQLAEGGYEATDAPLWFGMPGRLTPAAEDVLQEALAEVATATTPAPAHR
ncbi:hypothetical protein ACQBAU_01510 [Propionibacteriaceae bacterium Y2011]